MSSRKKRETSLPAPYLKRLWVDAERIPDPGAYPFCLPFLQNDFELNFDRAITIIVGENGAGKSTLLEGIAALAGYDTHSPILMAYPNATLLRLSKYGLEPVTVRDTDHFRTLREFCEDPTGFVEAALAE